MPTVNRPMKFRSYLSKACINLKFRMFRHSYGIADLHSSELFHSLLFYHKTQTVSVIVLWLQLGIVVGEVQGYIHGVEAVHKQLEVAGVVCVWLLTVASG